MHAAPERDTHSLEACNRPSIGFPIDAVSPRQALVIADDVALRESLLRALAMPSLGVIEVTSPEAALALLQQRTVDVVIADQRLAAGSGVDLLETIRRRWPAALRVLVTATGDFRVMCDAVNRAGVSYILPKPWDNAAIDKIRRDLATRTCPEPAGAPDSDEIPVVSPGARYGLVGQSRAIADLLALVEKVARTDSTVLVTGETGTGKELVGRAIHEASQRNAHVFSAINSAALPETLLESELFGHRKGSFTGASAHRKGLFEFTHHGTVFLDELAEMPLSMQAKLLRFLQTGEIRPVGGEVTRCVDVRLVSATNKDLEAEVAAGRFREDLYYRLAVIPVRVPPLRERAEDVPLLAEHFLRSMSQRLQKPVHDIDASAMELLVRHCWPGNVRELQNVIERGVALCTADRIGVSDLPARLLEAPRSSDEGRIQSLPGLERRHILETLDKVNWNRKRAAGLLQISTTTLWRRLKEFGIESGGRGPHGGRISING